MPYRPLFIAAFVAAHASLALAGNIVGVVSAQTPAAAAGTGGSGGGNYDSRRYKFLEKVDYSDLSDFVVSIDGIEAPPKSNKVEQVEQKDGAFIPVVLPITAGSKVSWPNRDTIFHNVFSMSELKPFDLGMYKSVDDPKSLVFDKQGRIDVFCAIHSQMHCVVLVLPNPWFDKSDRRGRFRIENVPPGHYTLKAWHERLPSKFLEVTVPEEGDVEVEIVMGFADLPKI